MNENKKQDGYQEVKDNCAIIEFMDKKQRSIAENDNKPATILFTPMSFIDSNKNSEAV